MPIPTRCDGCRATFDAPDEDGGHLATCPACGHEVFVPGGLPVATRAGPRELPVARVIARRRAPARPSGDAWKWLLAGFGGVAALVLLGCAGLAYYVSTLDFAPTGFATARSRAGGYRVYLRAPVALTSDGPDGVYRHAHAAPRVSAEVQSAPLPEDVTDELGDDLSPEALAKAFARTQAGGRFHTPRRSKPVITATTLGGQPAIELRCQDRPPDRPAVGNPWGNPFGPNPFGANPFGPPDFDAMRRQMDEDMRRMQQRMAPPPGPGFGFGFDQGPQLYTALFTVKGGRGFTLAVEHPELDLNGTGGDVELMRRSFKFQ